MFAAFFLLADMFEDLSESHDERETIERAKRGDPNAFEELMERYQKLVLGAACAMLGRSEDAPDVVQETFIKVYRSLPSFRGECSFSTWIYRICVNCAKDWKRRERGVTVSLTAADDEERAETDVEDTSAGPEQLLEEKARREAVWKAIGTLSEDHRVILVMRDMEGRSYEEIGEILGLAPGTVRSRLNRARAAVKKFLVSGNFI